MVYDYLILPTIIIITILKIKIKRNKPRYKIDLIIYLFMLLTLIVLSLVMEFNQINFNTNEIFNQINFDEIKIKILENQEKIILNKKDENKTLDNLLVICNNIIEKIYHIKRIFNHQSTINIENANIIVRTSTESPTKIIIKN